MTTPAVNCTAAHPKVTERQYPLYIHADVMHSRRSHNLSCAAHDHHGPQSSLYSSTSETAARPRGPNKTCCSDHCMMQEYHNADKSWCRPCNVGSVETATQLMLKANAARRDLQPLRPPSVDKMCRGSCCSACCAAVRPPSCAAYGRQLV
jgi:hypothetical protein